LSGDFERRGAAPNLLTRSVSLPASCSPHRIVRSRCGSRNAQGWEPLAKETLAKILDGAQVNVARDKLLEWIAWAARSRLPPFRKVARTIKKHLEGIVAYGGTGLSSGRSEGLNGKIRTITRRSFGFHSASSLIALIKLCCGGLTLSPAHR